MVLFGNRFSKGMLLAVVALLTLLLASCSLDDTTLPNDTDSKQAVVFDVEANAEDLIELDEVDMGEAEEALASGIATQSVSQYGQRIYSNSNYVAYRGWKGYSFTIYSGYDYYAVLTPRNADIDMYADTYNSSWARRRLANAEKGGTSVEVIKVNTTMLRSGESKVWFSVYGYRASNYDFAFYRKATSVAKPARPVPTVGYSYSPGPSLDKSVTIKWNAVSGAERYGLYIKDITANKLVYNNTNLKGTSVTLNLDAGHSYRYNMQSFNAAGASYYSYLKYFKVKGSAAEVWELPFASGTRMFVWGAYFNGAHTSSGSGSARAIDFTTCSFAQGAWTCTEGASIRAAKSGTIFSAYYDQYNGNRVVIDHGDGTYSHYLHLRSITKYSGYVSQGQEIGKLGNTGLSSHAHLDFRVCNTHPSVGCSGGNTISTPFAEISGDGIAKRGYWYTAK